MERKQSRISENWWSKLEKKYRIMSKKLIFGQTYMKFAVAMATSKMMDTHLTYQKFLFIYLFIYFLNCKTLTLCLLYLQDGT